MESLRTLLAIFDPHGGPEYEQFIATRFPVSSPARLLLDRFRALACQPPGEAPAVFGEETCPDPNIVAEYLDTRLADASLTRQFENAVLNDDVLLAELLAVSDLLENNENNAKETELPPFCLQRLYYIPQASQPPQPPQSPHAESEVRPASDPRENTAILPSDDDNKIDDNKVTGPGPGPATPARTRAKTNHAITPAEAVRTRNSAKRSWLALAFFRLTNLVALVLVVVLLYQGKVSFLWNDRTPEQSPSAPSTDTNFVNGQLPSFQALVEQTSPIRSTNVSANTIPATPPIVSTEALATANSQNDYNRDNNKNNIQPSLQYVPDRVEFLSDRNIPPERKNH